MFASCSLLLHLSDAELTACMHGTIMFQVAPIKASQKRSSSSLSSDSVGSTMRVPDTGHDSVGAWKPAHNHQHTVESIPFHNLRFCMYLCVLPMTTKRGFVAGRLACRIVNPVASVWLLDMKGWRTFFFSQILVSACLHTSRIPCPPFSERRPSCQWHEHMTNASYYSK